MSEKLKVLQAIDVYLPDMDGVINCVHNYSANLSETADVSVMAPRNKKTYRDDLPYEVIRCASIRVPILNQYYGFPALDKKFKKRVMDGDYDIIHAHSPFNMGKFALKTARKKGIPVVGTFHSNMRPIFRSIFHFPFIVEPIIKSFGRLYNRYDEMFVCSEKVGEQLRSFGYKNKITYLPFGTDFEKCGNVEELSRQANIKFGFGEDELIFVYIGRIMKLKRIDFILRSLKLVKDSGVKFRFYAVGKGPEIKKLTRLASSLGFTEKEVVFTGFLERELFPLISSRADLLLFPSLYDNFGLVKLECASYETAGVFIEGSCAGDGIKDGENGFLSEDDERSFADAVIRATADRKRLKKVGKNAQDTLYIHWSECAEILKKNYVRIIEEYKLKANENDNKK